MIAGSAKSLGEADPQFSSPSRIVIFEYDYYSEQFKQNEADDRMESEETSGIDPALLQAVLADPVLLQAVDPLVLQAVLVSAAAACFLLFWYYLDSHSSSYSGLQLFYYDLFSEGYYIATL